MDARMEYGRGGGKSRRSPHLDFVLKFCFIYGGGGLSSTFPLISGPFSVCVGFSVPTFLYVGSVFGLAPPPCKKFLLALVVIVTRLTTRKSIMSMSESLQNNIYKVGSVCTR